MRLSTLFAIVLVFSLTLAGYGRADDPPAEIADRVELCATCHGADGRPVLEEAPIIWGQEYFYVYTQLRDYQARRRASETMQPVVADLSRDEMKALAQYFSERKWPALGYKASDEDNAIGHRVATAGQCPQCHLATYPGDSRIPRMAGQTVAYLDKTMLDFKYKRRMNAPEMAALMASFSEDEIRAMAAFLAGL
ncbi:MAG: cytochrome c4 [Hyphomicrobiales bacterium]|nr:cytochrome c4 [Hyphomicrobiales bacterium]